MCSEGNGTEICEAASAQCIDTKGFTCMCLPGEEKDFNGNCKSEYFKSSEK